MTKSRKLQSAFSALLATVFTVVAMVHAGSHVSASPSAVATLQAADASGMGCALCATAPEPPTSSVSFDRPRPSIDSLCFCTDAIEAAPSVRAHSSRGPPSRS